jgi:hypothetical protein
MCSLFSLFSGGHGLLTIGWVVALLILAVVLFGRGRRAETDAAPPADAPLRRCGRCGYLGTSKARYCGQCGAPLSETETRT